MSETLNDKELLIQLKAGTNAAYQQLYKNHFKMVEYFVLKNSGTAEEAGDLFQEVVLALMESLKNPDFKLTAQLKTYVYAVARNLWLKQLKKQQKQVRLQDFEAVVPVEDPVMYEEHDDQTQLLKRWLEDLGTACKKLLMEFYYFKRSTQEIANANGYANAATVKSQKYKCLKRLRTLAGK